MRKHNTSLRIRPGHGANANGGFLQILNNERSQSELSGKNLMKRRRADFSEKVAG